MRAGHQVMAAGDAPAGAGDAEARIEQPGELTQLAQPGFQVGVEWRPDDPAVGPPGPRHRAPPGTDHNRFIAQVVADFGANLPGCRVYVFDNNSKDDTAAIARAAGETAPILFTVGVVSSTNFSLFGQNTTLSAQIFSNATQPGGESIAWGAALTLIVIVMAFTLTARFVSSKFSVRVDG